MQTVTSNVVHRIGLFNVAGLLSNHDRQFYFPIRFLTAARKNKIIIGAHDGTGRLKENNGLSRRRHPRLLGMVFKVKPNANDLGGTANG